MAGEVKLGMYGKIYYNAGSYVAPDWTELTNVADVTLNMTADTADATTRANDGWKATVATLNDASVDFQMKNFSGDADLALIRDAFFDKDRVEMLVLDGPVTTTGSEGLRAHMRVTSFTRGEALTDVQTYDVTLVVAESTAAESPVWYTVSGS